MCMRSVCMCVCVCPWVPACLYMSVCMCTCACGSVLMCACVSLCISVCTWVCMYVSVCPSVSLCACVFVHMGLYACVSVCPCVSVHVCMCTWVLCTCVCVSECVSVCMSVWAWVSLCMCPCAYVYMWVSRCALLSVLPFVQDPSPAQPLSSHLGMKGLRHVQGLRTVSPWTSDEGHALRRRLNLNPRSFKDAPCPEDRFKGSSRPVWATAGPSGLLVKRQFGNMCYLILSWNDSFEGVRWVFCPGPEASFCTWRGQAIMLRTQPRRRWGGKALETPSQVGRLRLWQGRLAGAPRGSAVSVGTPCCLAPSGLQGHLPQTSVGGAGKEVSKVKPWLWEGRRAGGEGAAEDGMAWWHHRLSGHQTNSGSWWRTGSLACCSPRSHKESDMTERLSGNSKLSCGDQSRWPWPGLTSVLTRRAQHTDTHKGATCADTAGRGEEGIERTGEGPGGTRACPHLVGIGSPRLQAILFCCLSCLVRGTLAADLLTQSQTVFSPGLKSCESHLSHPRGDPGCSSACRHRGHRGTCAAGWHVCCDPVWAGGDTTQAPQTAPPWSGPAYNLRRAGPHAGSSFARGLPFKPGVKAPAALMCLTRGGNWQEDPPRVWHAPQMLRDLISFPRMDADCFSM